MFHPASPSLENGADKATISIPPNGRSRTEASRVENSEGTTTTTRSSTRLTTISTNTPQHDSTPTSSTNSLPTLPCLLLPPSSNHSTTTTTTTTIITSKRILVQGPRQSGRTSLAMDLAYAFAATEPFPCHCLLQPCCCTNVVFYRRLVRRTSSNSNHTTATTQQQHLHQPNTIDPNKNDDDFPIRCRYLFDKDAGVATTGNSTSARVVTSLKTSLGRQDPTEHHDWDPAILRRIRIQYLSSSRELLQDLLEMLGKPLREHPTRAIVLDDLDDILSADDNINESSSRPLFLEKGHSRPQHFTNMTTRMMQTLAVVVDTSHALQRMHGSLPTVLVTASDRTKLVVPWMDMGVTLSGLGGGGSFGMSAGEPPRRSLIGRSGSSSSSSSNAVHGRSMKPWLSRWKATFRKIREHDQNYIPEPMVVEYCFSEHPNDGVVIEWASPIVVATQI